MDYPGVDGFLGTRASLMLDVVSVAMVAVLPVLAWSVALVRYRQRYTLHKRVQLVLSAVLLLTVFAFEADMRINGWRERAVPSPFYPDWVNYSLWVHLCFSVTTAVLWVVVIVRALRRFPTPAAPAAHSASHVFWARLAALDMLMTAATGWLFYWLAFAARA